MTQDQFSKLFRYMSKQFGIIRSELDKKADKADVDALRNSVDGLYKQYDRLDTELVATYSYVGRVDKKIKNHEGRLKHLEGGVSV